MKDFAAVAGILFVLWVSHMASAQAQPQPQDAQGCASYKSVSAAMLDDGYVPYGAFIDSTGLKHSNILINTERGLWTLVQTTIDKKTREGCVTNVEFGDVFVLQQPKDDGSFNTQLFNGSDMDIQIIE